MIGAAPVPVPPPRPVVTNTMSAPSSASMILSASSSAALRPTSGFAPAPRPLVSFTPSWIFTGAFEPFNACKSVLATTNSTPSRCDSIMRLTALPPPPPTPMTLILALFSSSSLKWMRMSFSGWFLSLKSSIIVTSVSASALRRMLNRFTVTRSAALGHSSQSLSKFLDALLGEQRLDLRSQSAIQIHARLPRAMAI